MLGCFRFVIRRNSSGSKTRFNTASPISASAKPQVASFAHRPSQRAFKGSASDRALNMQHFYTDFPLNRAAELRSDKAKLSELFLSPTSILIPSHEGKFLIKKTKDAEGKPLSVPFMLRNPSTYGDELSSLKVFLGLDASSDAAVFTAEILNPAAPWIADSGAAWAQARSEGPMMTEKDAALMATASGLTAWHAKNKFCGRCGGKLGPRSGGHSLQCIGDPEAQPEPKPPCRNTIFPRNDPATITLVTCGDWLLLGRKAEWTPGRYSLLAGFVEMGESLEQGTAREIQEESGIKIDVATLAYHSSQPWPFPQSLMIGMEAEAVWDDPRTFATPEPYLGAEDSDLRRALRQQRVTAAEAEATLLPDLRLPVPRPEEDELEDVRWFHKSFLKATVIDGKRILGAEVPGVAGAAFNSPGEYSLAGKAIKEWIMRDGTQSEWQGDAFPDVTLDAGTFKYVLMRLSDPAPGGRSKLMCHGAVHAAYHDNIYQPNVTAAARRGLNVDILGGGRIEHRVGEAVHIYGYSSAFGPAPHEVSAALVRRWFPFYDPRAVKCSYEGY